MNSLLYQLANIEKLEELEWDLRLSRQQNIGRDLHRALFGQQGIGDVGSWLHIVPELTADSDPVVARQKNDEFLSFVCRLPWVFLTRADAANAPFLVLDSLEPVSITIDAAPDRGAQAWFEEIKLPPYPRVLLIIPELKRGGKKWFRIFAQDDKWKPTYGSVHRKMLEARLLPYFDDAGVSNYVRVVRTFREFQISLQERFDPHVIYFYGHGLTHGFGTKLQFQYDDGRPDWREVSELRFGLDGVIQRTEFPPVIWINACLGAAAEKDSALRLLAPISCCVITTRTLAAVEDSRAIAEAALPMIVKGGWAPHSALRQVLQKNPPSVRSARWATTVIAVQYGQWSVLAPEARAYLDYESAGDFPRRVDRAQPLKAVEQQMQEKLKSLDGTPEAILWRGEIEQGLTAFEERVTELAQERFPDRRVVTRRVELQPGAPPANQRALEASFRKSLFYGLRTGAVTDATATQNDRIRQLLDRGPQTLLLISHGPFQGADVPMIKKYLEFWARQCRELTPPEKAIRILLGFGFFDEPGKPNASVDNLRAHLLGPVDVRELADHLMMYRRFYSIAESDVPAQAEKLVDLHRGMFMRIRRKLEQWAFEER
jgi:hypothetical protein